MVLRDALHHGLHIESVDSRLRQLPVTDLDSEHVNVELQKINFFLSMYTAVTELGQ